MRGRRGALCCLPLAALLFACAHGPAPRLTYFAMQGPPLAVAGSALPDMPEQAAGQGPDFPLLLQGSMERAAMVGDGEINLRDLRDGLDCQGRITGGPARNGRIRAIIPCVPAQGRANDKEPLFLMITLENLGPDQGLGLARLVKGTGPTAFAGQGELDLEIVEGRILMFFYHPWKEEAIRRLAETRANLAEHLSDNSAAE